MAAIDNGHALADLQPAAQLEVVPGAGHNLQQEQPEVLASAIRSAIPTGNLPRS
jgi:pimeloyl-ACP methyl ester carboxylesterase